MSLYLNSISYVSPHYGFDILPFKVNPEYEPVSSTPSVICHYGFDILPFKVNPEYEPVSSTPSVICHYGFDILPFKVNPEYEPVSSTPSVMCRLTMALTSSNAWACNGTLKHFLWNKKTRVVPQKYDTTWT